MCRFDVGFRGDLAPERALVGKELCRIGAAAK